MIDDTLLDQRHAPFNRHYLKRLDDVIACALNEYPRTFALRVDLHFSSKWAADDSLCCHPNTGPNVMARFTRSLSAKIEHYRQQRVGRVCGIFPVGYGISGSKKQVLQFTVTTTRYFSSTKTCSGRQALQYRRQGVCGI